SIKMVVGKTEGTAGLAGLLKAYLSLQAGMAPPNMLFKNDVPASTALGPKVRIYAMPGFYESSSSPKK
ncbi:uncharacterized protein BCR38DRAFT_347936, partial [Pseudomassariella vexata]